jgi:ABC-type Mn2+/Zn2+ transport system ATPase subunit
MIHVEKVTISLPQFALHDISFRVEAGQYAILMGKNGVGKDNHPRSRVRAAASNQRQDSSG